MKTRHFGGRCPALLPGAFHINVHSRRTSTTKDETETSGRHFLAPDRVSDKNPRISIDTRHDTTKKGNIS
ncbi:MAG: hypothetical protein CSA32_05525 [Desulfobulbus propionicus]|nr:MAG: hypothetical protein CSA32_05525 [Desulfobulbus propionicus]